MAVSAKLKYIHVSPQKARLVCDEIRGKTVGDAMAWLEFTPKKAAKIVHKLLRSAVANAENNAGLDIDELYISSVFVDDASRMKRFKARAKGRASRIMRRSSHITVVVATN